MESLENEQLILIVDDEENVLELLGRVLDIAGYHTVRATNVDDAWSLWKEYRPVLTVTDVIMHPHDGVELCRRIRQVDPKHPMVFISGNLQCRLREGVDDDLRPAMFMTKPFGISDLMISVYSMLAHVPSRREGQDG